MAKSKLEDIYNTAIEKWRENKCIGSILLPPPLNTHEVVLKILQKVYNRDPTSSVLIVVKNFKARGEIIYSLTHGGDEENDKEFVELLDKKYLRVYTEDFLTKWNFRDKFKICIILDINDYTLNMKKVFDLSTFKLVILTAFVNDVNKRAELYKVTPLVNEFKDSELLAINLSSPVEETQIAVDIKDDDEIALLKKYDDYIYQTVTIFGNFDNMMQAKNGNKALNISGAVIREQIAKDNGWSKDLDMSVDINVQLDNYYNPNALLERSELTFEIIRKRTQLLTDNKSKLEAILAICLENRDKRILIISKRGEFAKQITDYLNERIPNTGKTEIEGDIFDTDKPVFRSHPVCANFHDKVDKVPAWTKDGKPVIVKSGANKGMQKLLGADAQKSENQQLFNEGYIKILSSVNAADKSLKCVIDLLIITSPFCDTIQEIKYRLNGVQFNCLPNRIIKLYCKGTVEEKQLNKETPSEFHKIVNNNKLNGSYEENLGLVVVD